MPREGEVPLTQEGYEDMDAYFGDSPAGPLRRQNETSMARITQRSPSRYSQSQSQSQSQQPPSSASRRPRPAGRPDVAHEIGIRGRSVMEGAGYSTTQR